MADGFKIRLASDEAVELEFYGVIGSPSMFESDDDYVRAQSVNKWLREHGTIQHLRVFMNSPGGDVYDGFAIANRIASMKSEGKIKSVETVAEGLVASAATLVFLQGDDRVMGNGSRFMIHKPWTIGAGNAEDLREAASRMDQTEEQAIDLYEAKSALTRTELRAAMEAETYYTPQEAESVGFATRVTEAEFKIAAWMSPTVRQLWHKKLPEELSILPPRQKIEEIRESQLAYHPKNWQTVNCN